MRSRRWIWLRSLPSACAARSALASAGWRAGARGLREQHGLPAGPDRRRRHPIPTPETDGEQLEHLRRRLDPPRRSHQTLLTDRDLTEIAVHVQPDRPAHDNLLTSINGGEPAGERQRPIRARSTTRA